MLKLLICLFISYGSVTCGPNLCQNGGKLDSITYISTTTQWFFTSGGYYWLLKESEFPPKTDGKPLPGGFKRGDAAFFKNTLDMCQKSSYQQEIHLIEHSGNTNQVMVYDVRAHQWSTNPINYNQDKGIAQAKIDWRKPIEAAFTYTLSTIILIQNGKYAAVDISGLCANADGFGNGSQPNPVTDLNVITSVDATSGFGPQTTWFYLFVDQSFWKIDITKLRNGKADTRKNIQQNTNKEFFKFTENCVMSPDSGSGGDTSGQSGTKDGVNGQQSGGSKGAPPTHSAAEEQTEAAHKKDESGSSTWIIIIVIIIIIVLLALVLMACLMTRNKKSSDAEGAEQTGAAAAATPASTTGSSQASVGSKSGTDQTMQSKAASKTGSAGSAGSAGGAVLSESKTTSKTGSAGSGKGLNSKSSLSGTSPSTMSVRSKAN